MSGENGEPAGVSSPSQDAPAGWLLECHGLTKFYPKAHRGAGDNPPALEAVNAGVRRGECLGLVGESGSGKTTLANCLAGLLKPSAGTVAYLGEIISGPGITRRFPRVRGIQIVFQDPASSLNPRRTVGSVLAEIIKVHSLRPKREIATRVHELLGFVGLDKEIARRRPRRLSGGQQQRVAIARALAFEPRLVIADEIVSALDASVQAQILNLLADLREQLGLAIILVTHDMSVARHLCDRIAVMRAGKIIEQGPADQVLLSPAHPYTQDLLRAVPRLAAALTAAGPADPDASAT
jgi:ABC-type glutathione transport system ATPase component